jgi:hypothetical protein
MRLSSALLSGLAGDAEARADLRAHPLTSLFRCYLLSCNSPVGGDVERRCAANLTRLSTRHGRGCPAS